jgi:CheY-like chemotaxis protein
VVDIAFSGEEAWRKLGQGAFDCLLSDIRMDAMDGIELCHRVRARYPVLSVILMTAYDRRVARGDETGALAVLSKPLDMDELLCLLRLLQSGDAPQR